MHVISSYLVNRVITEETRLGILSKLKIRIKLWLVLTSSISMIRSRERINITTKKRGVKKPRLRKVKKERWPLNCKSK